MAIAKTPWLNASMPSAAGRHALVLGIARGVGHRGTLRAEALGRTRPHRLGRTLGSLAAGRILRVGGSLDGDTPATSAATR